MRMKRNSLRLYEILESRNYNNIIRMDSTIKKDQVVISDAKEKLSDILMALSWRDIARTYFGKSSSWLYHKLDGIKSDGTQGGGFSPEEAIKLKEALRDLADRINKAASSL